MYMYVTLYTVRYVVLYLGITRIYVARLVAVKADPNKSNQNVGGRKGVIQQYVLMDVSCAVCQGRVIWYNLQHGYAPK